MHGVRAPSGRESLSVSISSVHMTVSWDRICGEGGGGGAMYGWGYAIAALNSIGYFVHDGGHLFIHECRLPLA